MSTLLNDTDTDISEILCIRDEAGRPALRIGLLATMFIADSWTRPVREAVADAVEAYMQEFRPFLKWAKHPETGHMHPIDRKTVRSPREWLPDHEDKKSWQLGFHGGESANAAGEFQVSAFGTEYFGRPELGFFQFYLPLTWFAEHPGTFPDFVLSFANRLRPVSGYAGLGVLETLGFYDAHPYLHVVRELAERFPGLEVEDRIGHTIYVEKGIKGVNWLTLLGDHWVQVIGGVDYLRIRLGDDFKLTPYDGGLMIQAGPKPQIGDVTTNRWPRHYVTLAKVLKSIQVKDHGAFHWGDGIGVLKRMDHEASKAWLFRLDGK